MTFHFGGASNCSEKKKPSPALGENGKEFHLVLKSRKENENDEKKEGENVQGTRKKGSPLVKPSRKLASTTK